MSIFYNPRIAQADRVRSMKRRKTLKMVALIGAGGFAIVYAHAQTPAPSAAALEPIAFLTAHEWDAKLPDSPEGKKKKIHARFSWTQTVRLFESATNLSRTGRRALTLTDFTQRIHSSASS